MGEIIDHTVLRCLSCGAGLIDVVGVETEYVQVGYATRIKCTKCPSCGASPAFPFSKKFDYCVAIRPHGSDMDIEHEGIETKDKVAMASVKVLKRK